MGELTVTKEIILGALSTVQEPDLKKDLVTLNMIKDIELGIGEVRFTVVLTTPACPLKEKIRYIAHKNLIMPSPVVTDPVMPKIIVPEVEQPYQEEKVVELTTPVYIQNEPLRNSAPATENILVSIENEYTPKPELEKPSLFSRITGGSRIKIENDSNTRTSKKIIIENKKYQIIAGF